MRTPYSLILPLVISLLLSAGGCVAPLSTTRESAPGQEESNRWSLTDLEKLPEQVQGTAKTLVGKGEDPGKAREIYTEAQSLYQQAAAASDDDRAELFQESAEKFKQAADRWPESALQEDGLFMAGEGYFFADQYPEANEMYELVLAKYPNSKHLDVVESRRFSIAQFWLGLHEQDPESFWSVNVLDDSRPWRDSFGHAVRIFDRIRIDDPTGKLADDATLAAGNAYFAQGRYLDADAFYADLRKTFPSSDHQFMAHLLGVKAKLLSYSGPDYSGVPLDEAEALIKQIHRQFPREAAKEREYLARAFAEVRYKQAEREWHMARYYARRGEYGAARFHYNQLVQDFAETPFFEKAREQIAATADKPDDPPQRLEWLISVFPEDEPVKPILAETPSLNMLR
jgi:outer membrane protein assembly factor BamD (BamD/ComL family)